MPRWWKDAFKEREITKARRDRLEAEVRARLAKGERPKEIAEALRAQGKREVYRLAVALKAEAPSRTAPSDPDEP